MLETQLASVIAGTGTVIHDNSFIIGNIPNTTANDTLFVNNLNASDDVSVGGSISNVGNISTQASIFAGGSLTLDGSLNIGSSQITSQGRASFTQGISSRGSLTIDQNATVSGDSALSGNLIVGADSSLSGNLIVGGVISGDASGLTNLASVLGIGLSGSEFNFGNSPITDQNNPILEISLASTGVTAGNYGDPENIPSFNVNDKGQITSVSLSSIQPTLSSFVGSINSTPGSYGSDFDIPSLSINSKGFVDNVTTYSIAQSVSSVSSTFALSAASNFKNDVLALSGAVNGLCPLGPSSTVPAAYLPSYVDDVVEYVALVNFPETGETGKIYVDTTTNKVYRWSGSVYIEISASPGTTDTLVEGSTNLYFTSTRAVNAVKSTGTGLKGNTAPSDVSCSLAAVASSGTSDSYAPLDHVHKLILVNANTITGSISSGAISIGAVVERGTYNTTAPTGTIALDASQAATLFQNANATGNITLNITNATSLLTADGHSISVSFIYKCGASVFSITSVQVNGSTSGVTTVWQNGSGSAPTATASATNVYTFTVIRTAVNTYTILGNQSFFK